MRSTQFLLKHIPSIKFVGTLHPRPATIDSSVKPHAMSGGLIPNGEGTLQISDLSWPKLVIVAPPKKSASTPKAPVSQGLKPSDKPFDFTSVTQLPKKYQNPKFEEWEMDVVNGGGAGLLI